MWYRPKFNIFCPWLLEFCSRDMRDPRSYFMLFFFLRKYFFRLCSMKRPYSVDERLTKLPTYDELCYFSFFKLPSCPSSDAWDIAILFIFIMNYYHHFSNILVNFRLCMACALFHISINQ